MAPRAWVALGLLARTAWAAWPTCPGGNKQIAPGTEFGIGGKLDPYDDGAEACWVLTSPGTRLTLQLSFFQTEFQHDFLTVYDGRGDTDPGEYSGELPAPFVLRPEQREVLLHFKADSAYHSGARTQQLGLTASYFDSSGGQCLNSCSNHGACDDGLCTCAAGWGADAYTDCSIPVKTLENDMKNDIGGLSVGSWTYFKIVLEEQQTFLLELVDTSAATADPRLMVSYDTLPTLSHYRLSDWFTWFYDCSDIHFIRGNVGPQTLYVGVTNDALRGDATGTLEASVTLRLGSNGDQRCLLDCNGHGVCNPQTGNCACDAGWEGSLTNAPDTCQFQVRALTLDAPSAGTVRIGDWVYYKYDVTRDQAHRNKLAVEFYSSSPHAWPIALVRKNEAPRLKDGLVPTVDAFLYTEVDGEGFELIQGQRMSIIVNETTLSEGSWYVGVYNLWGHNGVNGVTSKETLQYSLTATLYNSGTPCPATQAGGFCDGNPCDFNTGKCDCPPDTLWRDCSFKADQLYGDGTTKNSVLDVGGHAYYAVEVTTEHIQAKRNLVVTLEVEGDKVADPTMRAAFEAMPWAADASQFTDHDLLANFYRDSEHQILLDAEELAAAGPGVWYVSVHNGVENSEKLTFSIASRFETSVDCPVARDGDPCDLQGSCERNLGRCDCSVGRVMDDCSADGVWALTPGAMVANSNLGNAKIIQVDSWAFWSVAVGCTDRVLEVTFQTTDDGSLPTLVIRRDRLPLMVQGTFDYFDYYNQHAPSQKIAVTSCGDGRFGCSGSGCCMNPTYPGSAFSTGAPEPGMYYIGLYNDVKASEVLQDYTLQVSLGPGPGASASCKSCAPGFAGSDCSVPCPGMNPPDVYSNSPVSSGTFCSGRGVCSADGSSCLCGTGYVGDMCQDGCAADAQGNTCGNCGACVDAGAGVAACACDSGYGGKACELECDGCHDHGGCVYDDDTGARCNCDGDHAGAECEFECPSHLGQACNRKGQCVVLHANDGTALRAACVCNAHAHGDACELTCPTGVADEDSNSFGECSGKGECVISEDGLSVGCKCNPFRSGEACQHRNGTATSKDKGAVLAGTGAAIFFGVCACLLLGAAGAALLIAERRRKKIDRYERLFQEHVPNALVERGATGEYEAPSLRGVETELTSRVADPDEENIFGRPAKSPSMLGEAARQTIALDATRGADDPIGGAEMI